MKTLKLSNAEVILLMQCMERSEMTGSRVYRQLRDMRGVQIPTTLDPFEAGRKAYHDAVGDGPEAA